MRLCPAPRVSIPSLFGFGLLVLICALLAPRAVASGEIRIEAIAETSYGSTSMTLSAYCGVDRETLGSNCIQRTEPVDGRVAAEKGERIVVTLDEPAKSTRTELVKMRGRRLVERYRGPDPHLVGDSDGRVWAFRLTRTRGVNGFLFRTRHRPRVEVDDDFDADHVIWATRLPAPRAR